jgi:ABC-type branched-subunit amino acid transport system ATPase component
MPPADNVRIGPTPSAPTGAGHWPSGTPTGTPRLTIRGAVKRFGAVAALTGVDLDLHASEVVGLIGPNGSGKTTLVNCLSGVLSLDAGEIVLDGETITGHSRVRRAKRGLSRTFQNLQLFGALTVRENLAVGLNAGSRPNAQQTAALDELIARLGLGRLSRTAVSKLPYGHQRRVEIGRALASRPNVLLLDEPAAGLNDAETAELLALLLSVRKDFACSMLVIDHDMALVLKISDRVTVLDEGTVIFVGAPDQVFQQHNVVEAYLGA